MRLKINNLFLVFLIFSFLGCKPSIEKQLEEINQLEKDIYKGKTNSFNIEKARELANLYETFAKNYPTDTNSSKFLFKAAELYINCNEPRKSIANFEILTKQYPNYQNIANVYFLIGFVYDSQIKDVSKARACYQLFIQKFPNHALVNDASACIRNLGKSDEELVKEFEERNKKQSDSLAKIDDKKKK